MDVNDIMIPNKQLIINNSILMKISLPINLNNRPAPS